MSDEFEIDLRKYANWILRSWVWILSLTFVAALGGFLLSTMKAPSYQAFATVIVAGSFDNFNFDPKILSSEVQQNYKPYLDLANSGQLKKMVYQMLPEAKQTELPFTVFQEKVAIAQKGSDESVIVFSVTLEDPENAAQLTNFWAQSFVKRANQVFGGQDDNRLQFYQDQLAVAVDTQNKTDQTLAEFQSKNKLSVLTRQLNSNLNEQEDYLKLLRNITHLEQNATDLREKIAAKPSASNLSLADETSILLMQVQMYNSELSGFSSFTYKFPADNSQSAPSPSLYIVNGDQKSLPVQMNIDSASLSSTSSADALASLDQIIKSIRHQKDWIEEQTNGLESDILALQQRVQTFQNEQTRLIQDQTVAHETTLSLSQKVQEVSISLQYSEAAGPVEVISEAITPDEPVSRNRLRNTGLAAAAGLILGILSVFLRNWWNENKPIPQKELLASHS